LKEKNQNDKKDEVSVTSTKVGVSYTLMSRYVIKGVQPPANTLKYLLMYWVLS
jgi:hypothetical protein